MPWQRSLDRVNNKSQISSFGLILFGRLRLVQSRRNCVRCCWFDKISWNEKSPLDCLQIISICRNILFRTSLYIEHWVKMWDKFSIFWLFDSVSSQIQQWGDPPWYSDFLSKVDRSSVSLLMCARDFKTSLDFTIPERAGCTLPFKPFMLTFR